eukprot:2073618-Amphidinium_carterae.1
MHHSSKAGVCKAGAVENKRIASHPTNWVAHKAATLLTGRGVLLKLGSSSHYCIQQSRSPHTGHDEDTFSPSCPSLSFALTLRASVVRCKYAKGFFSTYH